MPTNRTWHKVIDRHVAKIAIIDALLFVEPVLEGGEVRVLISGYLRDLALYLLPHDECVAIACRLPQLGPFQEFVARRFACLDASGSEVGNEVIVHPPRKRRRIPLREFSDVAPKRRMPSTYRTEVGRYVFRFSLD